MTRIPIEELKRDNVIKTKIKGESFIFNTTWGLFSPLEIDGGTKMLLDIVEVRPTDNIFDLGCGYGALGIPFARLAPRGITHMVDRDFIAVEYAKKNAETNGVKNIKAYLSNGFDQVPSGEKFDVIVSNLPAKVNKEFFWIMFAEAAERLNPGGILYVVTIKGLKSFIERNFQTIFGNYEKIGEDKTYVAAKAVKN